MPYQSKLKLLLTYSFFFLFFSVFLHHKSYNKPPTKVHAWAQSDHYALALGFYHDGFDFFHPTTFSLTHEFPAQTPIENPTGVTAVDFPIVHFAVGLSMKLLGSTEPWVHRLLMLLMSFFSFWMLFKTLSLYRGVWIAAAVTGFIIFTPIYTYYQNGFHVSAAAFNFFVVGVSFLLRNHLYHSQKSFVYAVIFFTLASLVRFTHIIPIIGLLITVLWPFSLVQNRKHKLITIALSLCTILTYFVYNKLLSAQYGSVFLGAPKMSQSLQELFGHLLLLTKSYSKGLLPWLHLAVLVVLSTTYFYQKYRPQRLGNWNIWLLFTTIGTTIFSLLMTFCMGAHDYYALDTWFPIIVMALLFLVSNVSFNRYPSIMIRACALFFLIGAFSLASEKQLKKYRLNTKLNDADMVMQDFKNSIPLLDSYCEYDWQKIMVICNSGWNIPMVHWHHKVYRIANNFEQQLPAAMSSNYDLVIVHNATLEKHVLSVSPDFEKKMEYLDGNDVISIWKSKSKLDGKPFLAISSVNNDEL